MRNIKALMYGWEFPPLISGGLGVACYAIVQELAKQGVKLTLVLPRLAGAEYFDGVDYIDCNSSSSTAGCKLLPDIYIRYPEGTTNLSPYNKTYGNQQNHREDRVRELVQVLEKMNLSSELSSFMRSMLNAREDALDLVLEVLSYALHAGALGIETIHDVIHAHDWLTILAALIAKHYTHKPVIFHVHALETDRSGLGKDERIFAIEKYGLEHADEIIAVSQYTKNNIVQLYNILPTKITVVHNGAYPPTSVNNKQKNAAYPTVLFLGRITQQKGPYFFIEVAKRVLEHRPNVHFVLTGTGDLLKSMIERVASLRIGKNVHFTGFLTSNDIRNIYELADIYVMPSVSEPFGLSALEALAHNVPAIISKQSGVSEVVRHALISDFWDVEDMAAKILVLLDNHKLRTTYVNHAKRDIKELTWQKTASKIVDLYNHLIREREQGIYGSIVSIFSSTSAKAA